MTRKVPGATRGRPKGSGAGLDVSIGVRLPPEFVDELDAAAAEESTDRSSVLRQLVGRWAKRRKGSKR